MHPTARSAHNNAGIDGRKGTVIPNICSASGDFLLGQDYADRGRVATGADDDDTGPSPLLLRLRSGLGR